MKIILTEKVMHLGNIGDIVNVSAGYGRNFLFPKKVAVLADESNKKQLAHYQKSLAKKTAEHQNVAGALKAKVDGLKLEFIKRVGASGKLFGTLTTNEVALKLQEMGLEVEKRMLSVASPIKGLGNYEVKAKLFAGTEASFEVSVIIDPKQAEENAVRAKEVAANKKEAAEAAALAAASGETEEEGKEKTEEERLKEVANSILR